MILGEGKTRMLKKHEDDSYIKYRDSVNFIQSDEQHNKGYPVRTEPLVEVLSVTLRFQHIMEKPLHICGNIFVVDMAADNKTCVLYKQRDRFEDPETIIPLGSSSGAIKLTRSSVMSMDKPCIGMNIQDSNTGETIVYGFAPLSYTVDNVQLQEHQFEQFKQVIVPGFGGCCAEVDYLALSFGAFACVEVQIKRKDKNLVKDVKSDSVFGDLFDIASDRIEVEEYDHLDVKGKVFVGYNLYQFKDKVNRRIILFESWKSNDEVRFSDLPFTLSRSVVAVPAYSPLMMQVQLRDDATRDRIIGNCEFQTGNCNKQSKTFFGSKPGVGISVEVTVHWMEPYRLNELDGPKTKRWDLIALTPSFEPLLASAVIEVFSVFIGRDNDEQLSLYGMVNLIRNGSVMNLFKRDKNDPYILSPGCNILPLEGPQSPIVPEGTSHVAVNLKDIEGRALIKGNFSTGAGVDSRLRSWFNRFFCSIIKGTDNSSFAAVHYTVYDSSLMAGLKIRFLFSDEHSSTGADCCKIHGSVVATNSKYGFETPYEKLYFRTVIFERAEENALEMPCKDFDMKLSRSSVAVPMDTSLCITVDLSCQSSGLTGHLKGSREFRLDIDTIDAIDCGSGNDTDMTIVGENFSININTEWCI